jgi:hypothetical protein
MRRVVLCALVAVGLASCGVQCGSSSSTAGNQHLVFTGPAAGTLTDANSQCNVYPSLAEANFQLNGTLGGQGVLFNIQIHSGYKGPGTYKVGSLLDGSGELRMQAGSYVGASASGAGTMTVDADGKSGSLDADLSGGEHVKGTFSCDQVATG